jgi:low temperature requirement protein LtrA
VTDDTIPSAGTPDATGAEHQASWLELFFDLVVVVAIAVLADRLREDPGLVDVALVLEMYLAIWLVWVSFMLYANVAGERTHQNAVIVAMGCMAVLAASIPGVRTGANDRTQAFALAYVVARVLAMNIWRTTARVLVDWPIAQMSIGLTPWIVSVFLHGDWRYWLWALGLALDIGFAVMANDRGAILQMVRRDGGGRSGRDGNERPQKAHKGPTGPRPPRPEITEASVNVSHLEERLGIFMIIVLGEAVSQIIRAAGGRDLTHGVARSWTAAFLLLVGLWWLTFQYGFAASPESRLARVPPRFGLPLHYLTTASIIFLATGLGETVDHPLLMMQSGPRWLAAGGLAGYFLVTSVAAGLIGAGWRWLVFWGLPSVIIPLVVGGFGADLAGWGVSALLLAAVVWQVSYGWLNHLPDSPRGAAVLAKAAKSAGAE